MIDRLSVHGTVDFRELCRRAVPLDTRYLVLDLDRTIHHDRNIGELVGWEYCSRMSYGSKPDARALKRGRGRFHLDGMRPLASARYLYLGARLWAYPGMFYLLWAKIAARSAFQRRLVYRLFGPEPISEIQEIPQTALLQQLATLPVDTVHELVRAVWRRQEPDMVIRREDLAWLRERIPGLQIILSSASPTVVLEVAAAELGVDAFIGTEVERHEGRLSAPLLRGLPLLLVPERPHRFSPPSRYRLNASYDKIRHLLERFPGIFDPGVTSVGISDNGYGEDGAFAEFFTHVIDVNSRMPFPPIVGASSPLREVHSAVVLTRRELERREAGEPGWTDPRRGTLPQAPARTLERGVLEPLLSGVLGKIEQGAARLGAAWRELAGGRDEAVKAVGALEERIEQTVASYNGAEDEGRAGTLERLRDELTTLGELRRRVAQVERPISEAAFQLSQLLDSSRRLVHPAPA
ncbi:MAG: HAD family hydrolase [Myxococcaceae bacterium]